MTDDNDENMGFDFMGTGMPAMTDMAMAGVHLHELYQSLTSAGFNPDQAMQLLIEILRSQLASGPEKDGGTPPL